MHVMYCRMKVLTIISAINPTVFTQFILIPSLCPILTVTLHDKAETLENLIHSAPLHYLPLQYLSYHNPHFPLKPADP